MPAQKVILVFYRAVQVREVGITLSVSTDE